MLSARDLSFAHPGGRTLLDQVQLQVLGKERIALVGENGAGKSTLLALLAGERAPDAGEVHRVRGATVGLLPQVPRLDESLSVSDTVRSGLGPLFALIGEHEALCAAPTDEAAAAHIGELTHAIEARGGFAVEHRIEEVLSRLGVRARAEAVGSLSGGERRRMDLARLVLSGPDVLLLDEPTNHLDAAAIAWLASELQRWPGAVLFVSHDRGFMDEVATRFLELEHGQLYWHDPPYAGFLEGRLERHELEGKAAQKRARFLAREIAWMKTTPSARTGKQKARIDRTEKLIAEHVDDVTQKRARTLEVRRTRAERLGKTILELEHLALTRGDRLLFRGLDLKVVKHERWGIVGPNGSGKTSLLLALQGKLEPTEGAVKLGKNTEVALLDQHRTALDPQKTLGETLCPDGDYVTVGGERLHLASYLESFLFDPKDRQRPVGTLSGGEQNRVHLARLLQQGANCLLLDEPTNDLDVTTLGVLEDVLFAHEGVAFIVSHDRAFLDRVCTGILAFEPRAASAPGEPLSEVRVVQGDYTHYVRTFGEAAGERAVGDPPPTPKEKGARDKSAQGADGASGGEPREAGRRPRKRTYKEEQEYRSIEERLLELEAEKEALEASLADGALFKDDPATAQKNTEALAALGPTIDALYARWQELEDLSS